MIREMTLADALFVIKRMRASDRRALVAVCPGLSDEQFAIDRFGVDFSFAACAADGQPVTIGGARVTTTRTAVLWMVSTDRIAEIKKPLLRFARQFSAGLLAKGVAQRLEGQFLENETVCERFAAHFGLEFEGCKRRAGAHGESIMIYGKVA